jgi:tetratricopeptide (TPR) repeat protein
VAPHYFAYGRALYYNALQNIEEVNEEIFLDGEQDEQRPDDLELAWEIFELCRIIYEREDSESIILCEIRTYMGDICFENANYTQAIEEYSDAIKLKLKMDKNYQSYRDLSSLYFKTGMSAENLNDINKALENFKKSKEILVRLNDDDESVGKLIDEVSEKVYRNFYYFVDFMSS